MTTHFTSGVTNVGADSTLGKFKAPAPHKYHTYFNDFDTYLASDWTITTTEDGTGSATEALADGDGGLLLVTNAAGDNDHDFFQLVKEGYKYELANSWHLTLDLKLMMLLRLILLLVYN